MKKTLEKLITGYTLTQEEARTILLSITNDKYNEIETTAFVFAFAMRPITAEELSGFRDALLEICVKIDTSAHNTIDLCGTGGDGKDTFNISTLASFVVAGADQKVVKHGNYGVSSPCGSSNIIEGFGVKLTNDEAKLQKTLEKANICYLHAPLFHPAMKKVANIRQSLRIKTFFNMLGPLMNPCFPQNQYTGVYHPELLSLYENVLKTTRNNYIIVHSKDGYDEVSLTDEFYIKSCFSTEELEHPFFTENRYRQEELKGGDDIKSSLKTFEDILKGNGTEAQNNVVVANASLALKCLLPKTNINICIEKAQKSLRDGKALKALSNLLKYQQ